MTIQKPIQIGRRSNLRKLNAPANSLSKNIPIPILYWGDILIRCTTIHLERRIFDTLAYHTACRNEQTFETAPSSYMLNNHHVPNIKIPVGPNLFHPAKWVKLNHNGTVFSFTNTQGPHNEPFIKDLYAQLDYLYNKEANLLPMPPLPSWFRHLLIRPLNEFQLL
jgi:hypothetical protein